MILQEGVDLAGEACSQKDSFKLTRVGVGAQFVYQYLCWRGVNGVEKNARESSPLPQKAVSHVQSRFVLVNVNTAKAGLQIPRNVRDVDIMSACTLGFMEKRGLDALPTRLCPLHYSTF